MSLHESNTPKQIARTFSLQENANKYKNKCPKNESEYKLSDELQKIKDEYETLERKNLEELEQLEKHSHNAGLPDIQSFLGKPPDGSSNREFTGGIETRREIEETKFENRKLDLMLTSKIEEISLMKKEFLALTETYQKEAEKLAEREKRTKNERDELKRKLEECQKRHDLQNGFIQELEQHNQELKGRLVQANREVDREIKSLMFEAETEKKRYLTNLKKLIELFQIEKLRIDESIENLSSDIDIEKNQHFQDVEQLKKMIDDLQQEINKYQKEKALQYPEDRKYYLNPKLETNRIVQEIQEHRKYSHELEMIIKNLGHDNQNLETENAELKKRYEETVQQITEDAADKRRQLLEEIDMFKHKFGNYQEIKAENEYVLAENEALQSNLNNIDEKYVRRIRKITADCYEKQKIMSLDIEKQNITIEKLNFEQVELQGVIASLEAKLSDKSNEYKDLAEAKLLVETRNKELENKLEKSQKMVDETIAKHEEHIIQIKSLNEIEMQKLKNEIAQLQKKSKDSQTEMIELETMYKILKVDFDEITLEANQKQTKFNKEKEALNAEFGKKVDELNAQIAEVQTANCNYEENELVLHKQIQSLVHNINKLNEENRKEVDGLREEIRKQIGQELEDLTQFKQELEAQIKQNEKENSRLKTELQFKTQKCASLEEELKSLKTSHKELREILEECKERYEDEVDQLKISNERVVKRDKDEISKLMKEYEQQSVFCDHLDKRKKELERLNKSYSDNLEHVTKIYEREIKDLRQDMQNTKTFYENKISCSKNEAAFEKKKYETEMNELQQEVKMLKYEVEWLREAQKE